MATASGFRRTMRRATRRASSSPKGMSATPAAFMRSGTSTVIHGGTNDSGCT